MRIRDILLSRLQPPDGVAILACLHIALLLGSNLSAQGASAPKSVYVDARYPTNSSAVGFPAGASDRVHWTGVDAFNTIQAGVDHVSPDGAVYVAAGTYVENVRIQNPVFLIGPNSGVAGAASGRKAEARIVPSSSDPENRPVISIESDGVVVDGFFVDGFNPSLPGGYSANGARVHAAAGIQNGTYPNLADVERITIRNNIITNISYDGICLDRYQYFGTSSAWNYICHNKLVNMWEGILTYAVDSVISNNVISNVTHGLGVHCVTTASPPGSLPSVAGNYLQIAQWWPAEIQPTRAPGVWINYRREAASPIRVTGNLIETPVPAPALKSIVGMYALTVDAAKVHFTDNVLNGQGNCDMGFLAANCSETGEVLVSGGQLHDLRRAGIQLDTVDERWGAGDAFVSVSNVVIGMHPGGSGVQVTQNPATPTNHALVRVTGQCRITGGTSGVQVTGANASACVVGNGQVITGNDIGVRVDAGSALLEGNALTNNSLAGISVINNGIVDAGDCDGVNVTGLGAGSGPNGASSGLNDLSGYGFDRAEPWAIINSGAKPVCADRNNFGLYSGNLVDEVVKGLVRFSGSEGLKVAPPPALQVDCMGEIPPLALTIDDFIRAGGSLISGTATSMTSLERIVTNRPGSYTLVRTYNLSGECSSPVTCEQVITARERRGPILQCSPNIIQGVDPGCNYATVTFTNIAVDTCGDLVSDWEPVSTGRFPPGTNRIIVIATDVANNSSSCSFDIAIIPVPVITRQPAGLWTNAGATVSFKVSAVSVSPMSFQWRRNGVRLLDGGNLSGTLTPELTVAGVSQLDAGDYQVEITNLAGKVLSASAPLAVTSRPGVLRILGISDGAVR